MRNPKQLPMALDERLSLLCLFHSSGPMGVVPWARSILAAYDLGLHPTRPIRNPTATPLPPASAMDRLTLSATRLFPSPQKSSPAGDRPAVRAFGVKDPVSQVINLTMSLTFTITKARISPALLLFCHHFKGLGYVEEQLMHFSDSQVTGSNPVVAAFARAIIKSGPWLSVRVTGYG